MNKICLAIGLIFMAMSNVANASKYWEGCDSCSPTRMMWRAKQAVPTTAVGQADVYIMDFTNEVIQKFSVVSFYDTGTNMFFRSAARLETESDIAYEFSQQVTAIKSDIAVLESGTVIPEHVIRSAFDIIHSSQNRGTVAAYIDNNLTIWQSIGAPAAIPLAVLGKIANIRIVVPVTFSDGSTATFALTGIDGELTSVRYIFTYVDGSALDSAGNSIPETVSDAAPYLGTFPTLAFAGEMADHIIRWYSGPAPGIECTTSVSGDNVTLTCWRT